MIQDEHIALGVAQGIITAEQAAQLRALATASPSPAPNPAEGVDPDDERFRLIGGFNDIFVANGILLLIGALFGLSVSLGFRIGFAVVAMAAAWALSEIFVRRLRLALPAIMLSLMFALSGGITLYMTVGGLLQSAGASTPDSLMPAWMLVGLGATIAAVLHRWRFGVPIDAAIIAGGLVWAIIGALGFIDPGRAEGYRALVLAVLGALIFVIAVRIDATDRERVTRRSDVAFWLHLLAAPMLVEAVSTLLFSSTGQVTQAVGMLALFTVFGTIALVLDRRALLLSGLAYAGLAIGYLLSENMAKGMSLSLTLLGLAALVLLLSAQWRRLRSAALQALPLGRFRQLVPPAS